MHGVMYMYDGQIPDQCKCTVTKKVVQLYAPLWTSYPSGFLDLYHHLQPCTIDLADPAMNIVCKAKHGW